MNENIKLAIWVVVIGGIFVFLWRKGYLKRLANYSADTREELRKCTWPTAEELKGSTVVVLIATALIGLFTVAIDFVIAQMIQWIT